jgi:hypothetical protein
VPDDLAAAADAVLGGLHRPSNPVAVLGALLGLHPVSARRVVGALVATSQEAEALLDGMHLALRSLAIATTDRPVRCDGEVRGPILWSETMAARSARPGDAAVVVCATPSRAFDTVENRVLVAALDTVQRAAHHAEGWRHASGYEVVARARHNAHRALRALDHPALSGVARRLDRRSTSRARAGGRRRTYRPALALLERAGAPLRGAHLAQLASEADRRALVLLAATLHAAADAGHPLPPLRPHHGSLVAGPVRWRHPDRAEDGEHGERAGLWIGEAQVTSTDDLPTAVAALA